MADITSDSFPHGCNASAGACTNVSDNDLAPASNIQNYSYCAIDFTDTYNVTEINLYLSNVFSRNNHVGITFEGSNNSTNGSDGDWDTLHTFSSGDLTYGGYPGWADAAITITNAEYYRWYRLNGVPKNNNSVLVEWTMEGTIAVPLDPGEDEGPFSAVQPKIPIRPGGKLALKVKGGRSYFTWAADDEDYSFEDDATEERENLIIAPGDAVDGDTIVVTVTDYDDEGDEVEIYVKVCAAYVAGYEPVGWGTLGDIDYCVIATIPAGTSGVITYGPEGSGTPPYKWEVQSGEHTLKWLYTNTLKNVATLAAGGSGTTTYRLTDATDDFIDCDIWPSGCPTCSVTIGYTTLGMATSAQQTLTVTGAGVPTSCYTWEVTVGGGTLDTNVGTSVVLTAPSSNPECANNATIELSCGGVLVDTIEIAYNNPSENGQAYAITRYLDNCPSNRSLMYEPYTCKDAQMSSNSCHGCSPCDVGEFCSSEAWIIAHCIGAGGCFAGVYCNPGTVDQRSGAQKTAGCCPAGLL